MTESNHQIIMRPLILKELLIIGGAMVVCGRKPELQGYSSLEQDCLKNSSTLKPSSPGYRHLAHQTSKLFGRLPISSLHKGHRRLREINHSFTHTLCENNVHMAAKLYLQHPFHLGKCNIPRHNGHGTLKDSALPGSVDDMCS